MLSLLDLPAEVLDLICSVFLSVQVDAHGFREFVDLIEGRPSRAAQSSLAALTTVSKTLYVPAARALYSAPILACAEDAAALLL